MTVDERTVVMLWATTPPAVRARHRRELVLGRRTYDRVPDALSPRAFTVMCANPHCGQRVLVDDPAYKRRHCTQGCRALAWYWRDPVAHAARKRVHKRAQRDRDRAAGVAGLTSERLRVRA